MFVEGWDEPGAVDLDKGILDGGVLDGVDSIRVDESTSTIWMEGWDWGGLDLTTLDELCFTLFLDDWGALLNQGFLVRTFFYPQP